MAFVLKLRDQWRRPRYLVGAYPLAIVSRPSLATLARRRRRDQNYDGHCELGRSQPGQDEALLADLCHRAEVDHRKRTLLVEAGALVSLAGYRNGARWSVAGVEQQRPLFSASPREDRVEMPKPTAGEDLLSDYSSVGLTLGPHPIALLREGLRTKRCLASIDLAERRSGSRVRVGGLVTLRQRPETAHGTTFLTLEDETGVVQVIVWPDLGARQRKKLLGSRLLIVDGKWEKVDGVATSSPRASMTYRGCSADSTPEAEISIDEARPRYESGRIPRMWTHAKYFVKSLDTSLPRKHCLSSTAVAFFELLSIATPAKVIATKLAHWTYSCNRRRRCRIDGPKV